MASLAPTHGPASHHSFPPLLDAAVDYLFMMSCDPTVMLLPAHVINYLKCQFPIFVFKEELFFDIIQQHSGDDRSCAHDNDVCKMHPV